jgi:hypothetical protein
LTVTVDPTGLSGAVSGTLTLTNTPGGATQTIPISLTVSSSTTAGAQGGKRGGCSLGAADGSDATYAGIEWLAGLLCAILLRVILFKRHRAQP